MRRCDVVIVGGGIGGSALATALAGDGLDVVVLEASQTYPDRVRGESMLPWGVKEAKELGVEPALLEAGAKVAGTWFHYDQDTPTEITTANPLPVGMLCPGVPGSMNLRHPDACRTLSELAASRGADVVRGVSEVEITAGAEPVVRCNTPSGPLELAPRLVVGADGRNSTVRRQAGIELRRQAETCMVAGLLLDGVGDEATGGSDFLASQDDLFMAAFFQPDDRIRLYLIPGLSQRHRFSGPDGLAEFQRSAAFSCLPFGEQLATAPPAGPLATYPGDDSWSVEPYAPGVVLVGDAAGYNNPIIGQGLSISMRDARMVRDVVRGGDLSPAVFSGYATERMERMRRLRMGADFMSATFSEDCTDRPARRARFFELQQTEPLMMGMLAALFGGPEVGPPEAFDGHLNAMMRGAPVPA